MSTRRMIMSVVIVIFLLSFKAVLSCNGPMTLNVRHCHLVLGITIFSVLNCVDV